MISTNQDNISDIRLFHKAAKLLRQNIFSAVDRVCWQLHPRQWRMADVVRDAEKNGEAQCEEFRKKRILSDDEAVSVTIKRQSLELLSHRPSSNSHDDAWGDKEKKMNIMQLI